MVQARKALTNAQILLVASAVQAGVPWEACAYKVGVQSSTLKDWIKQGVILNEHVRLHGAFPEGTDKVDWMFAKLAADIEVAHYKAVEKFARKINSASEKSWQAAAWWLDRRGKDMFALKPPEKVEEKKSEGEEPVEKTVFLLPDNGRGPAK